MSLRFWTDSASSVVLWAKYWLHVLPVESESCFPLSLGTWWWVCKRSFSG